MKNFGIFFNWISSKEGQLNNKYSQFSTVYTDFKNKFI